MGCEHEMAFAQQLAKVQAQTESNTDRIEKLEGWLEVVQELTTSVKLIIERQDNANRALVRIGNKLDAIEREPASRWKTIVDKALTTVVAALVGFALAKIGIT